MKHWTLFIVRELEKIFNLTPVVFNFLWFFKTCSGILRLLTRLFVVVVVVVETIEIIAVV